MMSDSESPEPLMPAQALVFAAAHWTTGDGVKKDTMRARRVRLARCRVRLVDPFDRLVTTGAIEPGQRKRVIPWK